VEPHGRAYLLLHHSAPNKRPTLPIERVFDRLVVSRHIIDIGRPSGCLVNGYPYGAWPESILMPFAVKSASKEPVNWSAVTGHEID
jgi:hypothetical protein